MKTKGISRVRIAICLLTLILPGSVLLAVAQGEDLIDAALARHGGASRLIAVLRIRMNGHSVVGNATEPVTISASIEANETGNVRIDYGQPVTRSYVNTPTGSFELTRGSQRGLRKSPHVGAFAQLDILSALGIQHLARPGVQRSTAEPAAVAGRPSQKVRVITPRSKTVYRRILSDDTEVQIDQETGLVVEIQRRHYAEKSLDVSFMSGFRFSAYREIEGVILPYRIDRVMEGAVRETITVDRIEINPGFIPDLFVAPRPARKTTQESEGR
jgi:hypothetical protein